MVAWMSLLELPHTTMHMIDQRLSFGKSIAQYACCFDARTYRSFRAVVESLILYTECTQAEFALQAGKSLAALQYFFARARWNCSQINTLRLRIIRHRSETEDRTTDLLVLDGTVSPRDKDCASEGISRVWDNCIKMTVSGYEVFGAAIVTASGITYPLTLKIYDPRKWDSVFQAWIKFLRWCLRRTKAMLVVVDRGFRNAFFLAAIIAEGRQFLVRVTVTMPVLVKAETILQKKRGRQPCFPGRQKRTVRDLLDPSAGTRTRTGTLWVLSDVIVDAWKGEVSQACSVIVFHKNGFREPMVLCSSEAAMTPEHALTLVSAYIDRWKIERVFLELKSWFQLTNYKLSTLCAIERYFMLCLVAHSLLQRKEWMFEAGSMIRSFIYFTLRKTRNIRKPTFLSLKRFYEMSRSPLVDLPSLFAEFLAKNYGFTY